MKSKKLPPAPINVEPSGLGPIITSIGQTVTTIDEAITNETVQDQKATLLDMLAQQLTVLQNLSNTFPNHLQQELHP